ncbi:MAG: SUMF1/EgtB/PvdO family nonheme iron enzyme, partial [bacterium]
PRRKEYVKGFCIEQYESPNLKGTKPLNGISWIEAGKWCESRGRRLCAENEWEKACAGVEGSNWSYGMKYRIKSCNIATIELQPSGSFKNCRSEYGVFDLNGNVAEWTSDGYIAEGKEGTEKMRIMKGGKWDDLPFFTRCASREYYPEDYTSEYFGVRCCADAIK